MPTGLRVLLVLALVAASAVMVVAEYALVTSRRWRLAEMAEAGHHGAAVAAQLMENPMIVLGTVQVGISAVGVGLGALGEPTFRRMLEPVMGTAVAVVAALLVTTYLYVVLGELVPKSLALDRAEPVAAAVARPMALLATVLRPLVWLLQASALLVLRPLGVKGPIGPAAAVRSEQELRLLLGEAEEAGIIEEAEEEMLYKVFNFADAEARDVMVTRPEIAAVPIDLTPRACLDAIVGSPYTRHPVYRGDLDHVVGILHLRDLFRLAHEGRLDTARLEDLVRQVPLVPETKNLAALLEEFRRTGAQMAIVLDEYGRTAGLITIEDLLEEIVGEISDEYDLPDESVRWLGPRRILVAGTFPLDDFAEQFHVTFPPGPFHTVAGLVFDRIGRRPVVGDQVRVGAVRFRVRAIEDLRISAVEAAFADRPRTGPGPLSPAAPPPP